MNELHKVDYNSPIGIIEITGTPAGITSILFSERDAIVYTLQAETPQVLHDCMKELSEYFRGERIEFSVPYISEGTVFQKQVWSALTTIPYAKTASYRDIAMEVGNGKAVRAVGNANSKNKLNIIVPCHRIIGSNGKLTGYAESLSRKEWLLKHEQTIRKDNSIKS